MEMKLLKELRSLPGRLIRFWNAPYPFQDQQQMRQAQMIRTVLRIMLVITILVYLVMFFNPATAIVFGIATSLLLVVVLAFVWLKRGNAQASALILVVGMMSILSLAALFGNGILSSPYMGLGVVVVLAGLLLGPSSGLAVAGVSAALGLGLLIADALDLLPTQTLPLSINAYWLASGLVFFALAGVVYLASNNLRLALLEARRNELAQTESLQELTRIRTSLEEQVSQRTQELEQRSGYLQAIVEVTQTTAALLNAEQLFQTAAELIREQFNLYYVGIFMTDLTGEWAVLQSGTGTAGKAMIERGHRIRIGSGMIGWSIANAQPRVAAEARQDAVRLVNPELPETRSEAAIPLRSRGRVIGAISVQSTAVGAFGELEIATFQALADQVAVSLDNARLYEDSRRSLEEARRAYGDEGRRSWQEYLQQSDTLSLSYRYGVSESTPARLAATHEAAASHLKARRQAISSGRPVQIVEDQTATLFLPIPVRETQIGVISFAKEMETESQAQRWSEDEIDLLQNVVEQMGVALDSARLYQDTQRVALREQLTGEVTSHIRQTLDIQTVLRTAVEEIQRSLGLPEVLISLSAPQEGE
jgi:GAF domain-containing protein